MGVVSTSTLSRWERGEEGLPVEIFEKLLTSMNISYNEIITSEVDIKQVIAKIEFAYEENDINELKKLSLCLLDKYQQSRDEFSKVEYLLKSAMAMNYYLDLSGKDLSDIKYKVTWQSNLIILDIGLKKKLFYLLMYSYCLMKIVFINCLDR